MKKIVLLYLIICSLFAVETIENLSEAYIKQKFGKKHVKSLTNLSQRMKLTLNEIRYQQHPMQLKLLQLKQNREKIENYLKIQKTLNNCALNNNDDRNLQSRILEYTGDKTCRPNVNPFKGLTEQIAAFTRLLPLNQERSNFQNLIWEKSNSKLLKSFAALSYKYSQESKSPSDLAKELCSKCNRKSLNLISKQIKKYNNEFKTTSIKRFSFDEVKDSLEHKTYRLNHALENYKGYYGGKSHDAAYKKYTDLYLKEASTGAGFLLMTDTFRKKVGKLRDKDKDFKRRKTIINRDKKVYEYKLHDREIDFQDIEKGINEIKDGIISKFRSLKSIKDLKDIQDSSLNSQSGDTSFQNRIYEGLRDTDIKKLIKQNPASLGDVLIENPEYSDLTCSYIKSISRHDDDSRLAKKYLTGGGSVLLVAGGVTGIAGWILGATTLATAGITAVTSGLLLDSLYLTGEAVNSLNESKELKNSFYAGTGDKNTILEVEKSIDHFEDTKKNLAINIGLTAVGLTSFRSILQLGKGGKQLKKLKDVNTFLKSIKAGSKLSKNFLKIKKNMGEKLYGEFLGHLSNLNKKARDQVLKQLENWNGNHNLLSDSILKAMREYMKKTGKMTKKIIPLAFIPLIYACGNGSGGGGGSGSSSNGGGNGGSYDGNYTNRTTLTWDQVTTNIDGSPVKRLVAYKIYYGDASGNYNGNCTASKRSPITVSVSTLYDPRAPGVNFAGLGDGECFFAVSAVNSHSEGGKSNEKHWFP